MESVQSKALANAPMRILAYYAAGVLAAAQFSKLAVLAPAIQADLGTSLAFMATLIALLEVSGALLGAWMGRLSSPWALDRLMVGALVSLAVAGGAAATATSGWALLAWRLLESAGYLGIVVAAPPLIAQASKPAQRVAAMTLWSTFVPVGLALGALLHSNWLQQHTWREVLALSAIGPAVLAVWLMAMRSNSDGKGTTVRPARGAGLGASRAAWCLALAFGGFTFFEMGLLALLPTLLSQQLGMPASMAGAWTGWTTLATIVGSAGGGWWMTRAIGRTTTLAFATLLLPPLGFAAVIGWPEVDGAVVIGLLVLINMLGGAFSCIVFSALPVVTPAAQRLPASYGAIAQLGAAGSLLGPPALALAVQVSGWSGAVIAGLLASVFSAGMVIQAFKPDRESQTPLG